MKVHLVTNGIVLAAYREDRLTAAEAHARTITGGRVQTMSVFSSMPDSVSDDINSDEWYDEPTPVVTLDSDLMGTKPDTPRAKARAAKKQR